MNWKKPKTKIFWVPVPYTPEMNFFELTAWQRNPEKEKKQIELTDPDTNEKYTCEILDYLGTFPMNLIPNWLAREVVDNQKNTGAFLAHRLKKKIKEFRNVNTILFYQLALKTL